MVSEIEFFMHLRKRRDDTSPRPKGDAKLSQQQQRHPPPSGAEVIRYVIKSMCGMFNISDHISFIDGNFGMLRTELNPVANGVGLYATFPCLAVNRNPRITNHELNHF